LQNVLKSCQTFFRFFADTRLHVSIFDNNQSNSNDNNQCLASKNIFCIKVLSVCIPSSNMLHALGTKFHPRAPSFKPGYVCQLVPTSLPWRGVA
jgi:hypothetical protein